VFVMFLIMLEPTWGLKKVGECMEKRGHGGKEMRGK